jgi:LETM1 and EF-hand domain-containing protein 1
MIESIRYQNEMIADEEKFRSEAKKKAEEQEAEALKAKEEVVVEESGTVAVAPVEPVVVIDRQESAPTEGVSIPPEAPAAPKTIEKIVSLDDLSALESLAFKSIVEKERQTLDQMKQNKSEMDVEGLLSAGRIGAQARENKATGRMMKKLDNMLSSLEVELEKIDRDVGDRLNILDKDSDGVLSADELKHAVMTILRKTNTEEDVEWLISQIDENNDGMSKLCISVL